MKELWTARQGHELQPALPSVKCTIRANNLRSPGIPNFETERFGSSAGRFVGNHIPFFLPSFIDLNIIIELWNVSSTKVGTG